jgi:hypothetical protein
MTDLITRLHAQAEKRGVATYQVVETGCINYEDQPIEPRHPLEIAMELWKHVAPDAELVGVTTGDFACRVYGGSFLVRGDFVTCVVALAELEALVGTIRATTTGCEVRNVRDIGVEQHSHEIGTVYHKATCKLFPDSFDEREPLGPCTCGVQQKEGA